MTVDDSGQPLNGDVVIRNTIEEAVFADAVGIDSFNIDEHYRPDLMDPAGQVKLAAIAGRTERIRFGTAVTVLSTQGPGAGVHRVRDPRRGVERPCPAHRRSRLADRVLPVVRFDLADNETLLEEKLDLLTRLLRDQPVTWSGTVRSPLTDQYVSPPLPAGHLDRPRVSNNTAAEPRSGSGLRLVE